MVIQSILFDNARWTISDAIRWLDVHGFMRSKVDLGPTYHRFRQVDPLSGAMFHSRKLRNQGIVLIFMY